jgi:hypothetical protein
MTTTTVAATATMEATAATTAVEAAAAYIAVDATTGESTSSRATTVATAVRHWASAIAGTSISITRPSVAVTVATTIAVNPAISIAITTTEPRAGADEEAAAKPRRAIISVRRAGIRGVTVVAVRAHGSRVTVPPIHRATDSNPNRNLSVRIRCGGEQQDTE